MRNSDRYGASNMTPLFVFLLGILLIVAGAVLNFTLFTKDDLPPDNGVFLDEEIVTYGEPYAVIQVRNFGDILIKLEERKAPQTVDNFKNLANKGFYDGLIFHRVIQDFMIQGGDPSGDGTGGPGYTIPPETNNGLKHDRGALSMAKRSGDERMSGSQFYIVQGANGANHLDGEHTVFGYVEEGMDIVDAIARTPVDSNDKPINPVMIEKLYVYYD